MAKDIKSNLEEKTTLTDDKKIYAWCITFARGPFASGIATLGSVPFEVFKKLLQSNEKVQIVNINNGDRF